MLRAGTAAAAFVLRECSEHLARGVAVFAGPGNNGGDAYVVAAQLARAGIVVRLHASQPPRTPDALRAMALAASSLRHGAPNGSEGVVIDGVLGTGHHGELRETVRTACTLLQYARDRGAMLLALDVPTGLDASTGSIADGSVAANVTMCFGSPKRGVLSARGHCGRVVVADIGLLQHVRLDDAAWEFAEPTRVAAMLPEIPWNAHKGTRGKLALVGGASGMAGAIVLAAHAALAAGAGLAKAYAEGSGLAALQQAVPQALAAEWGELEHAQVATDDAGDGAAWGDALAVGPGLGRSDASRDLLRRALGAYAGRAVVLDADALTLIAAEATRTTAHRAPSAVLAHWCRGARAIVCTPHPGEFARLTGIPATADLDARATALASFARESGATTLLKGTPTLVASPDGRPLTVIARGTALLATGGSGDLLTGIIGALLAAGTDATSAAVVGATVHGLAAEIATARAGTVRGPTLEAVLAAMPDAWRELRTPATLQQDILCELPAPVP